MGVGEWVNECRCEWIDEDVSGNGLVRVVGEVGVDDGMREM